MSAESPPPLDSHHHIVADEVTRTALPRHFLKYAAALLLLLSLAYWNRRPQPPAPSTVPPQLIGAAPAPAPPIGNQILSRYADPATPPREDLTWMSRALLNFSTLVKGPQPLPLGANEEITAALLGKNSAHLVFLQPPTPALNTSQQLIDRWGTPLYFHAESKDRIDIRSAGPDKQLWTADDLHRNADGHFRSAEELLPQSLYDPGKRRIP